MVADSSLLIHFGEQANFRIADYTLALATRVFQIHQDQVKGEGLGRLAERGVISTVVSLWPAPFSGIRNAIGTSAWSPPARMFGIPQAYTQSSKASHTIAKPLIGHGLTRRPFSGIGTPVYACSRQRLSYTSVQLVLPSGARMVNFRVRVLPSREIEVRAVSV